MYKILKQIFFAAEGTLQELFGSDSDVVSPEVKRILSNPKDRDEYIEALQKLEKEKKEVTIQLSDGDTLTLVS
ncbi:hypothetical protein [Niabella hirudinis]|uniref:hypothetical protein n=1 Tax=Niabella hirudinis TaxID=1285929 RepID=UPI003EBFAB7C